MTNEILLSTCSPRRTVTTQRRNRAKYSADFAKRFYAAQAARNATIVDNAIARLNALKQGKGQFSDDEPLVIRGMGQQAAGARLYQPDPSFAAHTKKPHTLLKADGTQAEVIVNSVRPPAGQQFAAALEHIACDESGHYGSPVPGPLGDSHQAGFCDYRGRHRGRGLGVRGALTPPPTPKASASPPLVLSNTCHYLLVPDEIIFDHLASKDKTLVFVEGSTHNFTPCRPEYGDTVKHAFDYVDDWLNKAGRF